MFAPHGDPTKIVALFAITATLANFLEGYSSSYPNTASHSFQQFINASYAAHHNGAGLAHWMYTWLWSFTLNIFFVGYFLGNFVTPYITDNYGRKSALIIANVINLSSAVILVSAVLLNRFELIIVGRAIGSAGSGLCIGALILFLQETTPTPQRGTCSFLSEVSYIAVNVVGMGMGMDIALGKNLVALMGLSIVPTMAAILLLFAMPESPKYLLLNRKDRKNAIKSIVYYQAPQADQQAVLDEMLKEADTGIIVLSMWDSVRMILMTSHLRRAMVIGICALQIIVGIWPIIYISTDLLETYFTTHIAQVSSFVFIFANFVASVLGMSVIERFGRRPMLICCGIANTLSLCLYILFDRLTFYVSDDFKYGCVASLVLYGATYGAALGPIAFFITSELVPQQFRSLVQSMVFSINTVINFGFSFVTLPLYDLIHVWSFLPLFVVPSTCAIAYLIVFMPETRGREIYEIVAKLKRTNHRKFTLAAVVVPPLLTDPTANSELDHPKFEGKFTGWRHRSDAGALHRRRSESAANFQKRAEMGVAPKWRHYSTKDRSQSEDYQRRRGTIVSEDTSEEGSVMDEMERIGR